MTYTEPNEIAFARSPILYGVFDALYINTDFRYTCDVYVWQGAAGGTKPTSPQYQLEKYPEPNGTARFNIQSLARDFLIDKQFTFSDENDTYETYSYVAATLNYSYTSGGSTVTGTPIVLDPVVILDGYNLYMDGVNYLTDTNLGINAFSEYALRVSTDGGITESLSCLPSAVLGLTGQGYWMTDAPLTMNIPTGTSMYRFVRNDASSVVYDVVIDINDGGLVLPYVVSGFTNEISAIKAGTTEVQALATANGYTTTITNYSLYGRDQYGSKITQSYDFTVVDPCRYGFMNLQFLNRYGVWDNFIVYGSRIESIGVTRTETMYTPLSMTTTPTFVFTSQEGQYHMRNVHGKESLTVNTGWVHEDWNLLLKQMMLTEYLFDSDNLVPYTIDTKTLTLKTALVDGLHDYRFELKYAHTAINTVY